MHHIEYTRNRVSSAVLLFFWLFVLISDGIRLRTHIIDGEYKTVSVQFILFAVRYALTVIIFALENMSKPKSQHIMLEDDDEVNALFPSKNNHMLTLQLLTFSLIHQRKKQTFLVDLLSVG